MLKMAVAVESIMYLLLVAFLWGATNPFIKKGAGGLENVKASSKYGQLFEEIKFLVSNMKYMVPFLINQCGSVLYFIVLGGTDISLAVPVANSLTFIFTAATGWLLGEERVNKNMCIGIALIIMGTFLCCWDKVNTVI